MNKKIKMYFIWLLIVFMINSAFAVQFSVNSELDMNDADPNDGLCLTSQGTCTLRAAISQSNHTVQPDIIILPAGHYPLSINGINEDANLTGDLDVLQPVHIIGVGRQAVIVDGMFLDRVIDVRATGDVSVDNLTLLHGVDGQMLGDLGSAIRNMPNAQLSINKVDIRNNGLPSVHRSAAILQLGHLDAKHIRITENMGHAIYIDGPITKLNRCLISHHDRLVIQVNGISQFSEHELIEIESCSIVNNDTTANISFGNKGINKGIMHVGSTIENIYISNTTVANNISSYLFLNDNMSFMHFNNSTLYNNQITNGRSVNIDAHNFTAETSRYTNTLMANNGPPGLNQVDLLGFLSLGGNYFSTIPKQLTPLPSDVIDPTEQVQLGQLSVVDDFTQIFYPLSDSPLIDAGVDNGCTAFDQLGSIRPIDGNSDLVADCDVGAIEFSDLIFYANFE